jgi:polyphosphate glucokinase
MQHPFGIDFGGTGIKGAPVDLAQGDFAHDRVRIDTPKPANPQAVAQVFQKIVDSFPSATTPVGVTVPGIVRRGVVLSAANIDKSWIGEDADAIFTEALGREVHVVNDADAAGLAEAEYGAAKGRQGLVMVITLGTGIGSAMLYDGVLIPNSELGHLQRAEHGKDAEAYAAYSAMEREELSWEQWAERLQWYYRYVEFLFSPDLFIVGGGVSKHADKFLHLLDLKTPIVPAVHRNNAGIIGAAALALG